MHYGHYLFVATLSVVALQQGEAEIVQLGALSKCERLGRFAANFAANKNVYLPSIIQCAVYCENYGSSWRYFYYEKNICKLYIMYPGAYLGICAMINKTMQRYCVGQPTNNLYGVLAYCRTMDMTLAALETADEIKFVFDSLLKNMSGSCVWTSAYSNNVYGNKWVWKTTGANITTFAWSLGHPTLGWYLADSGIAMCFGGFYYSVWDFTWATASPGTGYRPLCEQDVTKIVF